ncbi:hypothetical protein [Mycolicibacterium agri]|nr:hypothetical protein [Mycolicibacterium agri]
MTNPQLPAVVAAVAALIVACSAGQPAEPPGTNIPSGATPIPGGPMEPTPVAPSPKVPGSQQEAQDTVLQYLQRTVDGLPPGTVLDSTDTRGGGNLSCDDNYAGPGAGPSAFSVWTHVVPPAEVKPLDLVALAGDLWRSWGLEVMERNGFEKPNRFGYPADGYRVQIEAAYPPDYPPRLTVTSPCFPGELRQDGLPFPELIHQSPPVG